jgi:hypothetical protein
MNRRHPGGGPLVVSVAILLCCGTIIAEEGPILPGLDAIQQSGQYPPYPSDSQSTAKSRRPLLPANPVLKRQRPVDSDATKRAAPPSDALPGAQSQNGYRPNARGLAPEGTADRAPVSRSSAKSDFDRARSLGRSSNAARNAAANAKDPQSARRGASDSRAGDRTPGSQRGATLGDPWSGGRQPTDPRTRAALEREKAWRAGQDAPPGANTRSTRAGAGLPPKSPPRTAPLGRQPSKSPPTSSRTSQPAGIRFAR